MKGMFSYSYSQSVSSRLFFRINEGEKGSGSEREIINKGVQISRSRDKPNFSFSFLTSSLLVYSVEPCDGSCSYSRTINAFLPPARSSSLRAPGTLHLPFLLPPAEPPPVLPSSPQRRHEHVRSSPSRRPPPKPNQRQRGHSRSSPPSSRPSVPDPPSLS